MNLLGRAIVIGCGAALAAGSMLARAQSPAAASQAPAAARQGPTASSQTPVDYERDIQPIFEQHCAECHGRSKARARLRLHDPACIRRGGQSGPAILPGDSHDSVLMRRVLDVSEDDRMPLDADPLPAATVAILRAWIDQGAPMPGAMAAAPASSEHWAYVKPVAARAAGRGRCDLGAQRDRSVRPGAARAGEAGAVARGRPARRCCAASRSISPGCRRRRRRSTPSSPTRRPAPTSRLVDRLLASPHYGERWARPWLDLARYADSNGYEKDSRRVDLDVPRLGDRRVQPRHAVRPVHRRADRRRHAARRHGGPEDRHRVPSQRDDQRGGRHRSGRVRVRGARRSRQHDRHRLARHRRSAAPSATTTSTTPSRRRTTSG